MQKAKERTRSAEAKRPRAKRKSVGRGIRKPTPEEVERELEEDRKLVKFLSRGIAPFSAAKEQAEQRRRDRAMGR